MGKDAAIEELQKQIDNIIMELNLLKEQQALQTGKLTSLIIWSCVQNQVKKNLD